MQRPLSILIFRTAISLLVVAAPWAIGDYFLSKFNAHSIAHRELIGNLNRDMAGSTVLVGDCTVHPLVYLSDRYLWKSDVRVVSFGGSAVKEWYYLLKNNFDNFSKANHVVIATLSPPRFTYLFASYISFLPYVMTSRQIFHYYYNEGKIDFSEMLRFQLAKILETYPNSQEFRLRTLERLIPNYRLWHVKRVVFVQARNGWKGGERHDWNLDINTHTDPNEYVQGLAEMSHLMNDKMIFALSPRTKKMREEGTFPKERADWLELCSRYKMRCIDLTKMMPDEDFEGGDGMHLMNNRAINEYGLKLEAMILALNEKKPGARAVSGK